MTKLLNTADHFTLMMDHEIRRSGLAGNFCALAFELDGKPDTELLEKRTRTFTDRFPEINVRLRQKGRRYVWEKNPHPNSSIYFHHIAGDIDSAHRIIESIINTEANVEEAAPVVFHLIDTPQGSIFLLRWFHPICDAKGAELVVHHLFNEENNQKGEDSFAQLTAKWSLWKQLGMMIKAKRYIDQMDRTTSSLPPVADLPADRLAFKIVRFDAETSKRMLAQAMKSSGMTGTALYFIGCMMRAMQQAGCDEQQGFCVPYAMNLRRRKALFPLLGNQVSFLFAQATLSEAEDRKLLFARLRDQHKETVKQGLDHALVPLMRAGSWLPLEKYGQIIRNTPEGRERSSFWFSYTGEPEPKMTEVAGAPVRSMFQLSQVTSAPSLGLLVSQYNGEITLSFNYVANQIDCQWIDSLSDLMRQELLGEAKG